MSANAPGGVMVAGEGEAIAAPSVVATSEGVVTRWWIPALHLMVLGGMALAMFLFQLGTADWEDGMESIGGHIVEEIVAGSGWVLPLRNGRHMPLKPPLFHWLGALSAQLRHSGVDPLDARLPSALLGTLCVLLVYLLVRRLSNESVALWAGLVLATTPQFVIEARNSRTDISLCTFLTAGLLLAHRVWEGEAGRRTAFVAGLCIALATLSKGPLAIALALMVFGVLAIVAPPRSGWRALLAPATLAAALVLPLLWYGAATWQQGMAFLGVHIYGENVSRLLGEQGQWPVWYFFEPLLSGGLPWIVGLPLAAFGASQLPPRARRFFWVWFVVMFAFFSLAPGKRRAYMLPLRPAVAILIAGWLQAQLATLRGRRRDAVMPRAATRTIIAVVVLGVGAVMALRSGIGGFGASEQEWSYFWRFYLQTYTGVVLAFAVGIGVGAYLMIRGIVQRRFELAAFALAGTAAWTIAIGVAAASVVRGEGASVRGLARQIRAEVPPGESIAFFNVDDEKQISLLFHLHRHVPVVLPLSENEPCTPPAPGVYLVWEWQWNQEACFRDSRWHEMFRGGPRVRSQRQLRLVAARYSDRVAQ